MNCKKASTSVETAICNNKNLLALDGDLQKVYQDVLMFSPGDKLKNEQKEWLKKRDACASQNDKLKTCLTKEYGARFDELVKLLPFEKNNIDKGTLSVEAPRFKKDKVPAADKLNAMIQEWIEPQCSSDSPKPDDKESGGYDNINVSLEIISSDLVSLHAQIEYYCANAAHPNSDSRGGGVYSLTTGKEAILQNQDLIQNQRSKIIKEFKTINDQQTICKIDEDDRVDQQDWNSFSLGFGQDGVTASLNHYWPHVVQSCGGTHEVHFKWKDAGSLFKPGSPSALLVKSLQKK